MATAEELRAARTPYVLATVVRAERPTSAHPGDRAIILADGTMEGFVGGECAESTVRSQGMRLLAGGGSTLLRIAASSGPSAEGLTVVEHSCLSGGTLDIFLEAVVPPVLVHVYGASPIARAVAEVGRAAGYAMELTDDPATPIAADTAAVVVASHGRDEVPVLSAAVAAGVPYIALVASRRRATAVLAGFEAGRVHSPAGLDIGARTPGEIALSILAELVSVRPRG